MVDGPTLLLDVLETAIYFAAPALLWLFVYLLAYCDVDLARSAGFDRLTFWLLIPGALLGEFANVLVFGYRTDLLAINVGGGLIPAFLSIWLLGRVARFPRRTLPRIGIVIALGSGLALGAELVPLPAELALLLEAVGLLLPAGLLGLLRALGAGPLRSDSGVEVAALAIFGSVGLATFLTTASLPGTGIVSNFPTYLLIPAIAGAVAALALARPGGLGPGPTLALSYAGTTLGTLVGADVLRQPPLYLPNSAALYAIGGAGLLDLLHLSGLLALAAATGVVALLGPSTPQPPREERAPPSPLRRLRRAWLLGLDGRYGLTVRESQRATREAVATARRFAGLPPGDPKTPWAGLPVPPWVPIDQANLDGFAARRPAPLGSEAYRSWLTARALVATADHLTDRWRPSALQRSLAFAVDLLILGLLAAAIDLALVGSVSGPLSPVLNGIALDAAVVGAIGWGLVYFVGFEAVTGATPGKRLLGLVVRARSGGPPGARALWLRNLPRIAPLTILAYGVGLGVAVLTHPNPASALAGYGGSAAFLRDVLVVAGVGLAVLALASALTIGVTEEGQRLGDLIAGTWVTRERPSAPAVRRVRAPSAAAASPPAAG